MENRALIQRILDLKKVKNTVIFAHNYQRPEIFDIADFVGDSFYLAQKGQMVKAEQIVFCGVTFMGEMVKILNPKTRVFMPTMQASCPMAAMITKAKLMDVKKEHPKATVLAYVNTSAEIKAEVDVCCTSANAVRIVSKLPTDEIIFVPDQNLAAYVRSQTSKKIIASDGFCYVHAKITPEHILEAKKEYPDAYVIAHPECLPEVIELSDVVLSTSGMINYARQSKADTFLVATEVGMIEILTREVKGKRFFGIGGTCVQQKKVNLENLLECLENYSNEILLSDEIIEKASKPLIEMLKYGRDD